VLLRDVRRRGVDPAPFARADYVISHPHEFYSIGQMLAVWHCGLASSAD